MLSADSKIKQLMKNPEAVAILEEYNPGISTEPQMKMVYGLTLRKLVGFPQSKEAGWTDERLEECDAKLRAIEE